MFKLYCMDYAIITVPAAPVRRKPNHRSEMVNQLLFGETVQVLKSKNDLWVKIRSMHDSYEGWMTNTLFTIVDKDAANAETAFVSSDLLSKLTIGDTSLHIPVGATLPFFEIDPAGKKTTFRLAGTEYTFTGKFYKRNESDKKEEMVVELSRQWVNAPYLWGGRTPLGVDCSGFVQVIYKQMGIDLPRDAWQQAQDGKPVKKFSEIQPGDLAFFDNKEDIVHVGILLGDEQIIHASGKVRIDTITKKGLINIDSGKRTLRLKAVRRLW